MYPFFQGEPGSMNGPGADRRAVVGADVGRDAAQDDLARDRADRESDTHPLIVPRIRAYLTGELCLSDEQLTLDPQMDGRRARRDGGASGGRRGHGDVLSRRVGDGQKLRLFAETRCGT